MTEPKFIIANGALFTRDEAPGAYRNGTRVEKSLDEPGDTHRAGAPATVLGSIGHPERGIGYFVEWDDRPGLPVLVAARRVRALAQSA